MAQKCYTWRNAKKLRITGIMLMVADIQNYTCLTVVVQSLYNEGLM